MQEGLLGGCQGLHVPGFALPAPQAPHRLPLLQARQCAPMHQVSWLDSSCLAAYDAWSNCHALLFYATGMLQCCSILAQCWGMSRCNVRLCTTPAVSVPTARREELVVASAP